MKPEYLRKKVKQNRLDIRETMGKMELGETRLFEKEWEHTDFQLALATLKKDDRKFVLRKTIFGMNVIRTK